MRKILLLLATLAGTAASQAQTTYLPMWSADNQLIDRLETLSGHISDSFCLSDRPIARRQAVGFILEQQALHDSEWSSIERYNATQMISENGEWTPDGNGAIDSKHPWFNTFYKKQYDFAHIHSGDFFMVINPIASLQGVVEQGSSTLLQTNSRGIELRGWISRRLGFYTMYTANDEMTPSFVTNYIQSRRAVPGNDYYVYRNSDYNYLQASGYFDFAAVRNHLNITFGFGKHFIGDGITSLFLSDYSANYPFLRFSTRIWKINYENIFMSLTPQFKNRNGELRHRFTAIHHLSFRASRWLSMGFFESIISSHPDKYEVSYLNPVIFYRATEQANGSPDNEMIGYNFKIIAAKHLQFYGQFLFDEFKPKEVLSNPGFWGNKWAMQLGGKYFNAFGIRNLDLQAELNVVRPYVYSHYDTIANYTHYNQPLAHPLGSGFEQLIAIARYQPAKNLYIQGKMMYYIKGADTGTANLGNSIFLNYDTRYSDNDVSQVNGIRTTCMQLGLTISYQLRRNLFLDIGATQRTFTADSKKELTSSTGTTSGNYNGMYLFGGIRLNTGRRDYDFF